MKTLTLTLAVLVAAPLAAQTRHGNCSPGTAYLYTFPDPAPSGDAQQASFDLYFNNNQSGFALVVVVDEQTVLLTSNGIDPGDRFVHGSVRLVGLGPYAVGVACVDASAAYRLSVRAGDEVRLSGPQTERIPSGYSAAQADRHIRLHDHASRDLFAALARRSRLAASR